MSYDEDIVIDEGALDVEWLEQPRLMGSYCRAAAEAHRAMDLAEENLDFVRATLERAIRAEPGKYGVVPGSRGITEDAIKSAIKMREEYKIASRAYVDAKYEYAVAAGAVRAFDHRKTALEKLVQLHGQAYFSGPSVPRDLPAERALRDRAAQTKVRIGSPRSAGAIRMPIGDEHSDLDEQQRRHGSVVRRRS